MATIQRMKFCHRCDEHTVHLSQTPNHVLHLLLSVVTVGFWVPVWLLVSLTSSKPQCTGCGKTAAIFRLR